MGKGNRPACAGAIGAILSSRAVEQQSYRSCRAVMALADKHGGQELERACAKALSYSPRPSYKTIKSIIAKAPSCPGIPGCRRVSARQRLLRNPR